MLIWLPQLCNVPLLSCLTNPASTCSLTCLWHWLALCPFPQHHIAAIVSTLHCLALPCTSPNLISIGV